jgi:hypothetical protein
MPLPPVAPFEFDRSFLLEADRLAHDDIANLTDKHLHALSVYDAGATEMLWQRREAVRMAAVEQRAAAAFDAAQAATRAVRAAPPPPAAKPDTLATVIRDTIDVALAPFAAQMVTFQQRVAALESGAEVHAMDLEAIRSRLDDLESRR